MSHTTSRLYDQHNSAMEAVAALKRAGFADDDISLVAPRPGSDMSDPSSSAAAEEAETGAEVGGAIGAGAGLLAGLGLIAIPGIGPVVAAGWLASTVAVALAGAVAGGAAGGIIGALTDNGVPEDEAHVYAEGIRRGGSLVSVRTDDVRAAEAARILDQYGPVNQSERGASYRQEGWSRFDQTPPEVLPRPLDATRPPSI